MMSLNGPVPWMCKSFFHSLFPSTSSFIFTAAKHSSGGFVNGNTTYVCLSVLFLLGWPIVRQGLDDCIFVVIWTWFVGFPFSFGQWIQNKWVVSGGKGFRVSRTFRWAGPLFRYGSLSPTYLKSRTRWGRRRRRLWGVLEQLLSNAKALYALVPSSLTFHFSSVSYSPILLPLLLGRLYQKWPRWRENQ